MRPYCGPGVFFTVLICMGSSFAYMEALAAHVDSEVNKFEPQVAFICNKPTMHRVVNGWEPDFTTDCIDDPEEILNYCKKVYPDHDIKTVVELTYTINIPKWPKFDGPDPEKTGQHEVTPFRCLVKDFESEALLVPQHCIFDHEHDQNMCERPSKWIQTASDECKAQDMKLKSSGMLVYCGTDKFRGVEYVCCPKAEDSAEEPDVDSEESSEEEEQDDYTKYLQGNDMDRYGNEHAKFKAAEKCMQKRQRNKVTKMMKEWQEARDHVAEMRKNDKQGAEQLNKDITERFQRMYHALEQESTAEKRQLIALHQQRVQAFFNKKKRVLMTSYKEELEADSPVASKVLSYLKLYIRVEEKDRLHTVNMYEHRRDTDPTEALRIRDTLVRHLNLIDERITDAIDMLKRVPALEKKIRPEIEQFRHKKFRSLEINIDDVIMAPQQTPKPEAPIEIIPLDSDDSSESSEGRDYTNIKIDSEGLRGLDVKEDNDEPLVAHAMNDGASLEQASFKESSHTSNSANFVGIGIGSVAVFIIIVVAVVMVRKRNRRQPITHGFVEVDPAASPEERHVANMQMNGYENPTYRYFEMGTN